MSKVIINYSRYKAIDKLSKKLLGFICVTTNAYETFKGSTIAEKREFLNFIFSNLKLKGGKLDYSLAFSFDKLQEMANCPDWWGVWDVMRTFNKYRLALI